MESLVALVLAVSLPSILVASTAAAEQGGVPDDYNSLNFTQIVGEKTLSYLPTAFLVSS